MSNNPHPFDVPFMAPLNDPFTEPERPRLKCPMCEETQKITSRSLQYGISRHCETCGNEWSGGIGVQNPIINEPIPPPGVPAPDDLPIFQYTGAGFRDPNKNFDVGDY